MRWSKSPEPGQAWISHTGCASVVRIASLSDARCLWVAVCYPEAGQCGTEHCLLDRIINAASGARDHDSAIQAAEEHCAAHHRHGTLVKSASKLG